MLSLSTTALPTLALLAKVFLEPPARADTLWTKEQFITL